MRVPLQRCRGDAGGESGGGRAVAWLRHPFEATPESPLQVVVVSGVGGGVVVGGGIGIGIGFVVARWVRVRVRVHAHQREG